MTQPVRRLDGLRLLIAEDNEVNQMVIQAMLAPEGPQVTIVGDGEQAVACVQENGPDAYDLVLMDLQMPGIDGYEATRMLRAITTDLPIVAQTAHVLPETIERCRAAGMVAHVAKPIDRQQLVETILLHARKR